MHETQKTPSYSTVISEKQRNIVLTIVVLGSLMGSIDSTIVLLAFPVINDSLNSNFVTTIWIILVYLLILAVTTTQMGRLGDIYGRGRIFNLGFAVFTIGSALCGLSPHILLLITFRAVQALGGTIMAANSGAIIADYFPREVRGRAFGYNSLGYTTGSMLGIVVGGIITTFISWEYIFFINIPIGVIAVIAGLKYIKTITKTPTKIDLLGPVLLAASLSFLVLGLIDFTTVGFSLSSLTIIIIGATILPIFILYDQRLKNSTIDFVAFKNRVLRNAVSSAFFVTLGYFSVVFLLIMYLQGIRGLSPLDAALLLMPGYIVGSFFAPLMGRFSDKYGSREISTLGVVFLGIAILIYLMLEASSPLYVVLIGSAVSGFGTSMFFPANNSAVMANARKGSFGSISGVLRTVQYIGTLGSFVLAISVAASSIPRQLAFEIFIGTSKLSGGITTEFIVGLDHAFYVSLAILVIAGVFSFIRGKESRKENNG
jgi:EmrB/QacA subfamily drug resistance transporter